MKLRVKPSGNETAQRIIHHPVRKGGASSPSVRAPRVLRFSEFMLLDDHSSHSNLFALLYGVNLE